jgi:hypothetical protein
MYHSGVSPLQTATLRQSGLRGPLLAWAIVGVPPLVDLERRRDLRFLLSRHKLWWWDSMEKTTEGGR